MVMIKKQSGKGYFYAVFSAVIYGCMPLMAKNIYADGVNPITLVFLRNVLSLPILAILACRQYKSLAIPAKLVPAIGIMTTLGCCITPILLFSSYQFMESGTATVFHYTYPAIVVASEMLFLKKEVQKSNILCVMLCVAGIGLFYSPEQTPNLTGSILALSSGLTFAAYVVKLSYFDSGRFSGFLFCFYAASFSSIVALLFCLVGGGLTLPQTLAGWGLCLLFSLLVTTGAVVLFQQSAFLIGSERTSILSTLEPITSLVIGFLVFKEPMGIRVLIGAALVVTASLLIAVFDYKNAKS